MRYLNFLFSASLLSSSLLLAQDIPSSSVVRHVDSLYELHCLQDECWTRMIDNYPELGTFVGCKAKHGQWTDFSEEAMLRDSRALTSLLNRLNDVDRSSLSKKNQLQYDILLWLLSVEKSNEKYPFKYLCLNQMDGYHLTIPLILQIISEPGEAGYESIISRMNGVPLLIDQQIALLREGMKQGFVVPKIVMRSVPDQILGQIKKDPQASEFYAPFLDIDNGDQQQRALIAIKQKIYPAFVKLHRFISEEYIPACRETVGMSDLPNGSDAYAQLVKYHTTTNLNPEDIHQLGLKEVTRVQAEMEKVMDNCGFVGTIHEFAALLNNDPNSYYLTKDELLQGYRDLLSSIDKHLSNLFTIMPALPCEVVAVPEYAEESSAMAYYYPGSVEMQRPGRFFVNTQDLKSSPKWQMEALALHEALPGHHFQTTLAQTADLPMIQRHNWTTAFVEGWGLYSESLGEDLGLYKNPYSYFGRLSYEMLRSLRLVVDTGLHAKNWTRDEAIAYYKKHLPITEAEIISEIDRYIVMPAQALAYKIGEITIKSWREQAAEKPDFDIKAFHDDLLQLGGCLPLEAVSNYFLDDEPSE